MFIAFLLPTRYSARRREGTKGTKGTNCRRKCGCRLYYFEINARVAEFWIKDLAERLLLIRRCPNVDAGWESVGKGYQEVFSVEDDDTLVGGVGYVREVMGRIECRNSATGMVFCRACTSATAMVPRRMTLCAELLSIKERYQLMHSIFLHNLSIYMSFSCLEAAISCDETRRGENETPTTSSNIDAYDTTILQRTLSISLYIWLLVNIICLTIKISRIPLQ